MKYLLLAFVILISFSAFSQSPWVHEKGSGYSHISFGLIPTYSSVFKGDWSNLEELDYKISEFSAQSYTEIGIGKSMELTASVPLRFLKSTPLSTGGNELKEGSLLGLGGVDLGVKYKILDEAFLLTTSLQVNIPTAFNNEESGLRTSYNVFSFTPLVSAGKGWGKSYGYAYVGAGVFNKLSSDVRFGLEYGYKFKGRFWTILNFSVRESLENKTVIEEKFEDTFLFVNNQSYNSLSLKFIYELTTNIGINASTNIISLRANNLPFQRPFSAGAYLKW